MIASFAATPSRGAKIVVMGDSGTLIAEQPGPNPMEDGVVVASRNGESLHVLETPERYTPFKDPRDHRLMAFRLLVRDFTAGVEKACVASAEFHRRAALPGGYGRGAKIIRVGRYDRPS